MTSKWTSVFITCIQHPWIPNACSEGTRQPRQALHPLLLHGLSLRGHRRFCHSPLPRTVSSHSGPAHLQPLSKHHLHSSSAGTGAGACSRPLHPLPCRPARREKENPTRKILRWKMLLPDSSSSPGRKKSSVPLLFLLAEKQELRLLGGCCR